MKEEKKKELERLPIRPRVRNRPANANSAAAANTAGGEKANAVAQSTEEKKQGEVKKTQQQKMKKKDPSPPTMPLGFDVVERCSPDEPRPLDGMCGWLIEIRMFIHYQ